MIYIIKQEVVCGKRAVLRMASGPNSANSDAIGRPGVPVRVRLHPDLIEG